MKKPEALVHGLGLFALLYWLGWYSEYLFLETAIVVILMYEIGYKIPLMDHLIDHNEDLVKLIAKFFRKFRPVRRKRRATNDDIKRRLDSDTP